MMVPENAPVRLLNAQLEELEYGKLYETYSSKGRKSAADPRVLLKVLVHGYLCGINSSRILEEAWPVPHRLQMAAGGWQSAGSQHAGPRRSCPQNAHGHYTERDPTARQQPDPLACLKHFCWRSPVLVWATRPLAIQNASGMDRYFNVATKRSRASRNIASALPNPTCIMPSRLG